MKIFTIAWKTGTGETEMLSAHTTLEGAWNRVNSRTGQINQWQEHNAHGHFWVAQPMGYPGQVYLVEELELEGSGGTNVDFPRMEHVTRGDDRRQAEETPDPVKPEQAVWNMLDALDPEQVRTLRIAICAYLFRLEKEYQDERKKAPIRLYVTEAIQAEIDRAKFFYTNIEPPKALSGPLNATKDTT